MDEWGSNRGLSLDLSHSSAYRTYGAVACRTLRYCTVLRTRRSIAAPNMRAHVRCVFVENTCCCQLSVGATAGSSINTLLIYQSCIINHRKHFCPVCHRVLHFQYMTSHILTRHRSSPRTNHDTPERQRGEAGPKKTWKHCSCQNHRRLQSRQGKPGYAAQQGVA